MIDIEKSKSGVTIIKYNSKYIHSKYDPIREGEQFANGSIELINQSTILIYGLGLGYHIDAIVKKMNDKSVVYVFEYNTDLIRYCKEINSGVFKYKNVKIIGSDDKRFHTKLSKCLNEVGDIIIHRPSLETIRVSNEKLYNLINDYSIMKQTNDLNQDMITLSEENLKFNKNTNYKGIEEFIKKYKYSNKPYIIAAAGPSLDYELDLVKKNREKFNIIAVGSALRALIEKGIRPNAIVIIDGKEIVKKQFEGFENENIPLCFLATASRWVVSEYQGPKYMFNITEDDEIVILTRGTVAVAAMDISVKCGAKNIVFLGQDLAFIGDKSHTSTFEKVYGFKDNTKENLKNKTVKGVNGEYLNTTQGYITFKNRIESLIESNKKVRFVNCSKGAVINGAEHKKLEEFINEIE